MTFTCVQRPSAASSRSKELSRCAPGWMSSAASPPSLCEISPGGLWKEQATMTRRDFRSRCRLDCWQMRWAVAKPVAWRGGRPDRGSRRWQVGAIQPGTGTARPRLGGEPGHHGGRLASPPRERQEGAHPGRGQDLSRPIGGLTRSRCAARAGPAVSPGTGLAGGRGSSVLCWPARSPAAAASHRDPRARASRTRGYRSALASRLLPSPAAGPLPAVLAAAWSSRSTTWPSAC